MSKKWLVREHDNGLYKSPTVFFLHNGNYRMLCNQSVDISDETPEGVHHKYFDEYVDARDYCNRWKWVTLNVCSTKLTNLMDNIRAVKTLEVEVDKFARILGCNCCSPLFNSIFKVSDLLLYSVDVSGFVHWYVYDNNYGTKGLEVILDAHGSNREKISVTDVILLAYVMFKDMLEE